MRQKRAATAQLHIRVRNQFHNTPMSQLVAICVSACGMGVLSLYRVSFGEGNALSQLS